MVWKCDTVLTAIQTAGTSLTATVTQANFSGVNIASVITVQITGTDAAPDTFLTALGGDCTGWTVSGVKNPGQSIDITTPGSNIAVSIAIENQDNVVNGLVSTFRIWWDAGSSAIVGGYSEVPAIFLSAGQDISAGQNPDYDITDHTVPPGVYTFTWDDTGCDLTITCQCSSGTLSYAAAGTVDILLENSKVLCSAACYVQARLESYEEILAMHLWRCPQNGSIGALSRGYAAIKYGNARIGS